MAAPSSVENASVSEALNGDAVAVAVPLSEQPLSAQPESDQPRSDRLAPGTKVAYAMGGSVDILGRYLYNNLSGPVYNVFLGLTPSLVSITHATTLLVDTCSGLVFGWLSDNTRSRWGRRRPYILFGSILTALMLPCLFMARPSWSQSQIFWFMLVSSALFAPILAACDTPYQSLGAELTPDHEERTSVMAYKGVVQKVAGTLVGGSLWFATRPMFNDPLTGQPDIARGAMWAAVIAGLLIALTGVANFVFIKERYYEKAKQQGRVSFASLFKDAFKCRPYLILLGTSLMYAIPVGLLSTFAFYAITYHVFRGDIAAASEITFYGGLAFTLFGLAGIAAATSVARRIGKRDTLIAALLVGVVAFGSSWWLITPEHPWLALLCGGLNGFSNTALWVVLPSMIADVVDHDELESGKRREGVYHSTFTGVVKVGTMLSMLAGGPLLELTGFDAKLGGNQSASAILGIRYMLAGLPVAGIVLALFVVQLYPLSAKRMAAIRGELESRRGVV